jgi:hypothetical protein
VYPGEIYSLACVATLHPENNMNFSADETFDIRGERVMKMRSTSWIQFRDMVNILN